MRLAGARVALSATEAPRFDLSVRRGRILPFETRDGDSFHFELGGYLLLPGLINSHDHLEFNLFPRLDKGRHENYIDWAASVFEPECTPLKEHLSVPKAIRLVWGGLKNLLSGVTTVSHHNPYESKTFDVGFPVRVVKRFGWAHSLHFSTDLVKRFRGTPRRWPFLLHAAEGTDRRARAEIESLAEAGVLSDRTALIHGVAVDLNALEILRRHGTSLIWCPSSNLFTLGRTLADEILRSGLPIALGTDSALTGEGDLIDEIALAQRTGGLTACDVFRMVTTAAAALLRLSPGQGAIVEQGVADLLAVEDGSQDPAEALRNMRPELVVVAGKIKLISRKLAARLPRNRQTGLQRIALEGRGEYLIDARIAQLHTAAARFLGPRFRLAGREVSV